MSDRHLYRAKRADNSEWVEGYLYRLSEKLNLFIMLVNKKGESYKVDPSTICQCTGLTDQTGKLIWENDICIIHDSSIDEEDGYFTVEWDDDGARFALEGDGLTADFDSYHGYECEVIGSAIDNPELLEEQDE